MILPKLIDSSKSKDEIFLLKSSQIKYANWVKVSSVQASFIIWNDRTNIYLQFKVSEPSVLGRYKNINDPVYKDSCVEFFISLDKVHYYNFEFNCIGTVLAQFGKNRNDRVFLNKNKLEMLSICPSLGKNKIEIMDRTTNWTLDIKIPIEAFHFSEIDAFSSLSPMCNFYKCGDDLPEPHYLSWNPIKSKSPDFHKPEYFSELKFK